MILEQDGTKPMPYGAIGELCLGDCQLAREYLNLPEATQKAFVTMGPERSTEQAILLAGALGSR